MISLIVIMDRLHCKLCKATFESVDGLVKHLNSYPSSKLERFKCGFDNCFMIASNCYIMKRHLNSHILKGM